MTDYTSAEFWAGAPEGATHCRAGEFAPWRRVLGGGLCSVWAGGKWIELAAGTWSIKGYVERPTTQPATWNGDGLPPIGVECERNVSRSNWCTSKIFAHSPCGSFAAFLDSCGMNWAGADSFRLIRTPEQVEADEREACIRSMCKIMQGCDDDVHCAQKLYDHGLRFKDDAK